MASAQGQYTDELKRKFGYYATWNPGVPLKLGDIGTLKDNVFTRLSTLEDFKIKFDIRPDETKTPLEHNSQGSVSVTTKLSGTVAPQGSALTNLDAGIIVEFTKENSTLFKANNTTSPSIKDAIKLGNQILELYKKGKWNKNWVIITELVEAENATIIISNNSNGKIELKANANIDAPTFDIADAEFKFSTQFSRGLETKIISAEGLTPLFKIMGIKTRIFLPPIFKSANVQPFDLLTPDSARNEHKNDIFFGYISSDLRE
ncbi:MAG: hypothetical protein IPH88_13700 [Bacteroidales bacterium]|nr:hypothetical protein [Bacteroidales bacterium]